LAINIHVDNQLYLYQCCTLIDITPTGVVTYTHENSKKRNQQRNWETVIQILSLRTQPQIISTHRETQDLTKFQFGITHSGKHTVWSFIFGVEYKDVYRQEADPFCLLRNDFKYIPVITKLDETIEIDPPMFIPSGPMNNIYFKSVRN